MDGDDTVEEKKGYVVTNLQLVACRRVSIKLQDTQMDNLIKKIKKSPSDFMHYFF